MDKKAVIITYGCSMNVNESAKLKNILQNQGYQIVDKLDGAKAVFLNTCTVREGAATQIYGKLGELKTLKQKYGTLIGVVGCFAQEQGEELALKFPQIDIVMGNQNLARLPEAMEALTSGEDKHIVYVDNEDELPPRMDSDFGDSSFASIPISYGCNNFCSFCIVPYVRGRERSVPLVDIVKEAKELVTKGYKEITLIGQNVNSYGNDLKDGTNFSELLKALIEVEGDFWIRFISPHPKDFTEDLIDVIASSEKIAKSIHLPLQSGSTKILKSMNRGYSKEDFIAISEKIKKKIPEATLSTDIIVGFPGETEEDFLDTLDVVERVGFDSAYMFMYSVRRGTAAEKLAGHLAEETKKTRLHRLMDLQNKLSKENSQKYLGTTQKVFVEGPSKRNKAVLSSRTSTNKVVLLTGSDELIGNIATVKIVEAKTWTLYGEIIN